MKILIKIVYDNNHKNNKKIKSTNKHKYNIKYNNTLSGLKKL